MFLLFLPTGFGFGLRHHSALRPRSDLSFSFACYSVRLLYGSIENKKKQLVIYPNVDRTYLAWSPTKSECVHRAIFYVVEMILCRGSGWSNLMQFWQRICPTASD